MGARDFNRLPPSLAPLAAAGHAHRARVDSKQHARRALAAEVETIAHCYGLDAAQVAQLLAGQLAEYEKRAHAERAGR